MRFDKLTIKAQDAFQAAQEAASRYQHQAIEPEHLLTALLEQSGSLSRSLVEKAGANANDILGQLDEELKKQAKVSGASTYGTNLGSRLTTLFNNAFSIGERLQDEYISTEHLLLATLEDSGPAGRTLKAAGLTKEALEAAVLEIRAGRKITDPNAESNFQ
ncbi:MAG: type VI secretion system ATPase TssH, partial [Armatimonadetes bacterium]|nr:type VI secretion system ATPase TssH [Armatimonadota bacterium]